jgi:hypothetical protein
MSPVSVLVPIEDAVAWDPWLTTELGNQAERLGLGYDGGEESGPFEVFDFEGDPEVVERAVIDALGTHKISRPVSRAENRITVAALEGRWLVTYASQDNAYGKALRRVTREVAGQQDLARWFAGTGLQKVWFHESHAPGRPALFPDEQEGGELYLMHYTDLTILDEKPSRAEAERVAREHVQDVLEAVAEHLDRPLPVTH